MADEQDDRKRLALRLYDSLALDPHIDREALTKWLLEQFGLIASNFVKTDE